MSRPLLGGVAPANGGASIHTKADKEASRRKARKKKSRKRRSFPSQTLQSPKPVQRAFISDLYAALPLDEREWVAKKFPSPPSTSRYFSYRPGQVFTPSRNPEEVYQYQLKVKGVKIQAWWEERGKYYAMEGCRFLLLTLTFKDEEAFAKFEEDGGRRMFMKKWKRENKNKIKDYVCVVEFQKRGVIHYHYIIVAEPDAYLTYPDQTVFKDYGSSNLKSIENAHQVLLYLIAYVKKMKQLDYQTYLKWKKRFGRFRLYEFGRPHVSRRGALKLVERGWGRYLYFGLLKDLQGWTYDGRGLEIIRAYKGEEEYYFPPYFAMLPPARQSLDIDQYTNKDLEDLLPPFLIPRYLEWAKYRPEYQQEQKQYKPFEFFTVYVCPVWLEFRSPMWSSLTFDGFHVWAVWCKSDSKKWSRYEHHFVVEHLEALEAYIQKLYSTVDIWEEVYKLFDEHRSPPPTPELPAYCLDW